MIVDHQGQDVKLIIVKENKKNMIGVRIQITGCGGGNLAWTSMRKNHKAKDKIK